MGLRISYFFGVPWEDKKSWMFLDFFMGIRISECFFFWTSLWGSEFLNVFWTSLWGSEFLNVFWTSLKGIRISECFLDFFYGDRNFWTLSFQIFMEIRNSEFSPESFSVIRDKKTVYKEFLNVFWTSLKGITISECFLDFFYGDRNFWTLSFQIFMEIRNSEFSPESFSVIRDKKTVYKEFLNVFWTSLKGITISECFLDFFYGDRNFWTLSFQIFMEIRNSEFSPESFSVIRDKKTVYKEFLNVFWTSLKGITISECFLDFFYGDRNFWTLSFQIFMEIRNSEFSPESFSVIRDKKTVYKVGIIVTLLFTWKEFGIPSKETNRSCKFYINFSIWSESEKLSVELSADIPFPKKLFILFWSYFTLFFEQTWDTATFKNHFLM